MSAIHAETIHRQALKEALAEREANREKYREQELASASERADRELIPEPSQQVSVDE
jgi:hypothetical protein